MSKAESDSTVKVHYTGKLSDGEVFDSSVDREPLEFSLGQKQVIPGFENAVLGMEQGEKKTITIPSGEAYGPHRSDLVVDVQKNQVPPDITPEPGLQLQLRQQDGTIINVTVTGVTDTSVTLDANHPLAGKDLTFEIELVDIS